MLDIEVFDLQSPIYDNGKKVGFVPHLALGSYTQLSPQNLQEINEAKASITPGQQTIFASMIRTLGQISFANDVVYTIEHNNNPMARQTLFNVLQQTYSEPFTNRATLLNKQDQIIHSLRTSFQPLQMVAMMIQLKAQHDEQKKRGQVTRIQDEHFTRGIAKCVQSIRDLPEKEKTPLIQHLCRRSTHRWSDVTLSYS